MSRWEGHGLPNPRDDGAGSARRAPPAPTPAPAGRWRSAHLAPLLVAVAGLAVTAAVTVLSHVNYVHSEQRVLTLESTLTESALAVGPVDLERRLGRAVTEASLTHGSAAVFQGDIATSVGTAGPLAAAALYQLGSAGPHLLARAGAPPMLAPGSPALARLCAAAARVPTLAVARVLRPGAQRLAYAMAATAPGGGPTYVVYGEQVFPADRRATAPPSGPGSGLNFAIYFGKTTRRAALVEASTATPVRGTRVTELLPFGNRVLTVVVAPKGPLVGTLAASVAWIFLVLGLLLTILAVAVTERLVRRRRRAERTASVSRSLYQDQRAVVEMLQQALLPLHLPQPPGFEVAARYRAGGPGADVGGDWYDVLVEGDELFFSVGDVSGHGLEAAAVMAQLRHAISAHGFDGAAPATVLGKVTTMVSLARHGRFATVLCGRVRLSTGELHLANAGHVTPLLLGPGGARVLEVPPDPPLGVGTVYRTHELRLDPGETFLAVTDGLVERRGERIDEGLERLRAAASGALPLEALLDSLVVRLVPEGAGDDIAMLAIRRDATVPSATSASRASEAPEAPEEPGAAGTSEAPGVAEAPGAADGDTAVASHIDRSTALPTRRRL